MQEVDTHTQRRNLFLNHAVAVAPPPALYQDSKTCRKEELEKRQHIHTETVFVSISVFGDKNLFKVDSQKNRSNNTLVCCICAPTITLRSSD